TLFGSNTHDGKRATLTFADGTESIEVVRRDGHDVTLLRLVAPDFGWRHAGLFEVHFAQIESCTTTGIVDQFRESVGQTAGAYIVYRENGVVLAQLPAPVDNFLGPALNLGVT